MIKMLAFPLKNPINIFFYKNSLDTYSEYKNFLYVEHLG